MKSIYRVICALLILFMFGLTAMADTKALPAFRVATGIENTSIRYKQLLAIYTELFRRLELPIQFTEIPYARSLLDTNTGLFDAEAGRNYDVNDQNIYPNLIRVNEPVFQVSFAVFARDSNLQVNGWEDLSKIPGNLAYQRGQKVVEKKLLKLVSSNQVVTNNTIEENCRMLLAGRITAFIGVKSDVLQTIKSDAIWQDKIRHIGVLETYPTYPYFNVRNKHLIPKVEKTLKAMKADGTYAKLLETAEQNR